MFQQFGEPNGFVNIRQPMITKIVKKCCRWPSGCGQLSRSTLERRKMWGRRRNNKIRYKFISCWHSLRDYLSLEGLDSQPRAVQLHVTKCRWLSQLEFRDNQLLHCAYKLILFIANGYAIRGVATVNFDLRLHLSSPLLSFHPVQQQWEESSTRSTNITRCVY